MDASHSYRPVFEHVDPELYLSIKGSDTIPSLVEQASLRITAQKKRRSLRLFHTKKWPLRTGTRALPLLPRF